MAVDRPTFFIGMGRSGTTLIFEAFATHPDLAWFSQYISRLPWLPSVSILSRLGNASMRLRRVTPPTGQPNPWSNRVRVGPSEPYSVWRRYCDASFLDSYLLGVTATDTERRRLRRLVGKVTRYQGCPRFAAKITGPGRVEYLSSVFPDARFVHVIRDGRAVVHSLLRTPFWRDTYRMDRPAWWDPSLERELSLETDPPLLAAVQWRLVVETIRDEAERVASDRYAEMRYEDFVAAPHEALDRLVSFCDLRPSKAPHRFVERRVMVRDMNVQWQSGLRTDDLTRIERSIAATLKRFGYRPTTELRPGALRQPFQSRSRQREPSGSSR